MCLLHLPYDAAMAATTTTLALLHGVLTILTNRYVLNDSCLPGSQHTTGTTVHERQDKRRRNRWATHIQHQLIEILTILEWRNIEDYNPI